MFRRLHFQTKMILAQNSILLLALLAIGSIFYLRIRNTMVENALEDFQLVSDGAANQIDNHFYMMDKTALQIAANPDVIEAFVDAGQNREYNYFVREPLANAEIVRLLTSYNFKRDGFERICIYNDYQDFVYTANETTMDSGIGKWFASEEFARVQEFFSKTENVVYYVKPSPDIFNDTDRANKPYFSVIRQIKNYTTNDQECGYVEVQEFVRWIDDVLENTGEDMHAALLDESGDVIYMAPSAREHGMEEDIVRIAGELESGPEGESGPRFLDGYAAYLKELENAPYRMVFAFEGNTDVVFFNRYNRILLLLVVLIFALAAATEYLLVKRLARPLKELNRSVQELTLDNPQLEVGMPQENDELLQLRGTFNAMIARMKQAMEREYSSTANELKAQMLALQSQMDPHFLFNILAIISMEAEEFGDEKIPDMCTRLRRMMAYSSSIEDGYSQIGEELNNARDYMELMKVRYEELFEYSIEEDETLRTVKMPKYILQPICENSFKHSFKHTEPVWRITIRVYREDDWWSVEIHDNGVGFSEEYLRKFERMKEEMTFAQVRDKLETSRVGGLGIENIFMRLMFCYGDRFVFRLYNDDEGAAVLLGGMLDDEGAGGGGRTAPAERDQQDDRESLSGFPGSKNGKDGKGGA